MPDCDTDEELIDVEGTPANDIPKMRIGEEEEDFLNFSLQHVLRELHNRTRTLSIALMSFSSKDPFFSRGRPMQENVSQIGNDREMTESTADVEMVDSETMEIGAAGVPLNVNVIGNNNNNNQPPAKKVRMACDELIISYMDSQNVRNERPKSVRLEEIRKFSYSDLDDSGHGRSCGSNGITLVSSQNQTGSKSDVLTYSQTGAVAGQVPTTNVLSSSNQIPTKERRNTRSSKTTTSRKELATETNHPESQVENSIAWKTLGIKNTERSAVLLDAIGQTVSEEQASKAFSYLSAVNYLVTTLHSLRRSSIDKIQPKKRKRSY